MSNQSLKLATLLYSMVAITACASQPSRDFMPSPTSGLGVISEADIASSHGTTAYEVVDLVRPQYLMSRLDLAPNAEREVYLNGIKLGGVGELRLIPAREVKEIRFLRAIDLSAYGVSGSRGALLVVTKAGR